MKKVIHETNFLQSILDSPIREKCSNYIILFSNLRSSRLEIKMHHTLVLYNINKPLSGIEQM